MASTKLIVGLADAEDWASRAVRRVTVHADYLKATKQASGDVVALARAGGVAEDAAFAIGVLWPSLDIPPNSVKVSPSILATARLSENAEVRVYALSGTLKTAAGVPSLRHAQDAGTIRFREISDPATIASTSARDAKDGKRRGWLALLVREHAVNLKYILPTQIVELRYEGQLRRFEVESITPMQVSAASSANDLAQSVQALSIKTPAPQIWTVGWDVAVHIVDADADASGELAHKPEVEALQAQSSEAAYAKVGGLDTTIAQIRDLLEIPLTRPDLFAHFGAPLPDFTHHTRAFSTRVWADPHPGLKPPRGILLHGPPGTGKTHLARAIAASTRSSVLVVNGPELSSAYHGETEAKLRDVFREAREKSPCIVVLDELDALVPRREDAGGGEVEKRVVATLLTVLDGMDGDGGSGRGKGGQGGGGGAKVVVIGTTNRPNAIDPALRRPGRFDREFEIGVPDAAARLSILQVLLSNTPHTLSPSDLHTIASRAHGYVGADLSAVVREAGTLAIKRWTHSPSPTARADPLTLTLTAADLLTALPTVRPSALRSVFVESAPVRYSDVGGQAPVIARLREAVEWPLLHPEAFARLGVRPPRGLLLYGPPGCSKTVLARACATESGVNFVAVKGPELLNKFVGESERAVREIFRKARALAPCIIFFDEIDALGTSRTSGGGGGGGAAHEGVLTSLLNEMDGVQELVGVTIIAATNRPDVIDSALMRPGRLDRILYVGPPDLAGREEILRIRTGGMSVQPGLDVAEIAKMTEGCSGAEISALCQEAALITMKEDIDAEYVSQDAFFTAARAINRQITPDVIRKFEQWRERNGLKDMLKT
ncbi:AAA-domain-containing protein [Coniophora puteana RWD-64-598 SS2]|uniref:AAA-domain-containing protein n=1 Tax=Coniophora puteana (strain RWD-64-598) TaxID=741705 RepID=A0A5M3MQW0_CONPW|nr:AAA-domain-containing protein [Coniophora puteana RWD-64-598 SS2]EIW81549.1 AAA-domain-containing protein [Coniophora puteana RWD-64-598 SS2]